MLLVIVRTSTQWCIFHNAIVTYLSRIQKIDTHYGLFLGCDKNNMFGDCLVDLLIFFNDLLEILIFSVFDMCHGFYVR